MSECPTCKQDINQLPTRTRILHYWGPSIRQDGGAFFLYHVMRNAFPAIWNEHYECSGDSRLHGKADLNIEVDWAGDAYGKNDYFIRRPNFYWVSDSHFGIESYRARMSRARMFGVVGTNIRDHVGEFIKQGPRAFWLPYAVEPTCYRPLDIEKVRDWCFVGHSRNTPQREQFIDDLVRAMPDHYVDRAFFEDANKQINLSRIAVNYCMTDFSSNMRTFELLATGVFSLHSHTKDLGDLGLTPGYNIETFRTVDECVDKMKYYLANYDKAKEIAARGLQTVLAGHTYLHRAVRILRECGMWELAEGMTDEKIRKFNLPKDERVLAGEYLEKKRGEK